MERIVSLYKIMLLLSAVVMTMGLILNISISGKKASYLKMLLIMAVVNIISISVYLLNLKASTNSEFSIAFVFVDSIILILNLIIAHYVYQARIDTSSKYEKQILNLFIVTFICCCLFIIMAYAFHCENSFFKYDNKGFPFILSFASLLILWGTIIPGFRSIKSLFVVNNNSDKEKNAVLSVLLILNMLNNIIGLYLYVLEFPTKEFSVIMNMLANLSFAYYFSYYLLSEYFRFKKDNSLVNQNKSEKTYSWQSLRNHLNHWSETRSYLIQHYPELIDKVEKQQHLSDLEKIHLTLKYLNIKAKEVAVALNITTSAVEMQRYRIGKKITK